MAGASASSGSRGRVTLYADGNKLVDAPVAWDTTGATGMGARMEVWVGIGQYDTPTPAFDVNVDNVVVDPL